MRKIYFSGSLLFISCFMFGQAPLVPQSAPTNLPISNVSNQELFKDRSKIYFDEGFYMIDGRKVSGSPFLYRNWEKGTITIADGRVFSGYRIKYNAFHQTVYFHNGTDSLEVDDEIREFSMFIQNGDSVVKYTFVNASQLKPEKKPLYYELIADKTDYQLYKLNKKFVAEASKTIPVAEGRKIFDLELSYFYFNRKSKKLTRIRSNSSNLAEILGITREKLTELKPENYDFSNEADIIRFFELQSGG